MNKVSAPDAEVPPRLWDFPLLRLPWLEAIVGVLLVFAALSFMADDHAGAQFIAAFIWIPGADERDFSACGAP